MVTQASHLNRKAYSGIRVVSNAIKKKFSYKQIVRGYELNKLHTTTINKKYKN